PGVFLSCGWPSRRLWFRWFFSPGFRFPLNLSWGFFPPLLLVWGLVFPWVFRCSDLRSLPWVFLLFPALEPWVSWVFASWFLLQALFPDRCPEGPADPESCI